MNGNVNILQGSFHRLYISGILSEYSHSSSPPFLTLTVPHLHEESRYLYFGIPFASEEGSNASELTHFAYTAEIDPLPVVKHVFECTSFPI